MNDNIKRLILPVVAAVVLSAGAAAWLPNVKAAELPEVAPYAEDTEYTYGNYKYRILDDNKVEITGWAGDEEEIDVDIPAQIDGKQVYSLGENVFFGKRILSLKLPDGLAEIKSFDWMGCYGIPVEIPESVTSIPSFMHLGDIKYIAIPQSLRSQVRDAPCPVTVYHTDESGRVVIDEVILNSYSLRSFVIPESIRGKTVSQVKTISDNPYAAATNGIVCASGIALPEITDKILARYEPESVDTCKITSVSGVSDTILLLVTDDINGRSISSINGVAAGIGGIAVLGELADRVNADCAVLSCVRRGYQIDVIGIDMNKTTSLHIGSGINTVIMPQASSITLGSYINKIAYTETEDGVVITEISRNGGDLFIPSSINGKTVTKISDSCSIRLDGSSFLYMPSSIDSDDIMPGAKFLYTENQNGTVSVTGISNDLSASGGSDLEDIFGRPIDTLVTKDGLNLGLNENKAKNIVKYQKNDRGEIVITCIKQGGGDKSTVTIPETIDGINVLGIKENAVDGSVTAVIVPDSLSDSVPESVGKVTYKTDEQGNFFVTSASENVSVHIPESVGGKTVETVIISETVQGNVQAPATSNTVAYTTDESGRVIVTDVRAGSGKDAVVVPETIVDAAVDTVAVKEEMRDKVKAPEASSKIIYSEDENGSITVTDIQQGAGKDSVVVPGAIGGKSVETVIVKADVNVTVPKAASKITYTEDGNGRITIIGVVAGKDDSGNSKPVQIPSAIGGVTPVLSEEAKAAMQGIAHTHRGGTAAYGKRAVCSICGMEYGELPGQANGGASPETGSASHGSRPPAGPAEDKPDEPTALTDDTPVSSNASEDTDGADEPDIIPVPGDKGAAVSAGVIAAIVSAAAALAVVLIRASRRKR